MCGSNGMSRNRMVAVVAAVDWKVVILARSKAEVVIFE